MQSRLPRTSFAVAAMLVLRWSTVEAQAPSSPAPASASQRAAAKKLTQEAIEAEDAREYAKAIALYQQAYSIVPHPILQFNIGQVHMLAGDLDQAEKYYRLYLTQEPNGRGAPMARKFLASRPVSPRSPPAANPTGSGKTSTPPNGIGSSEHADPDTREARLTTEAGEHRPDQVESAPVASPIDNKSPPQTTEVDRPSGPPPAVDVEVRLERARALKLTGYKVLAGGVGLGLAAIGLGFYSENVGRGVGAVAFLTTATGVGVLWYANNQVRAAKAVTWSPVLGSGFAGIALAGTLP